MLDIALPFHLLQQLVATVLAAAHSGLAALGLAPDSGLTWSLSIAVLVVSVRVALLPLAAHGIRTARAAARARPAQQEVTRRYAGKRDLESLQAMRAEQRAIHAEHGVSALGCLPVLLQLPILFALYGALSAVATRQPIGAMDVALVASAGSASLLGVTLADRWGGTWAASPWHALVIVALAATSAGLSYTTQRWFVLPNTVLAGLPTQMAHVHRFMPALSAVGVLFAAGAVPVGLLVYWVASNAWTLGQSAVVCRWFPTPGSAAFTAWEARRA
ncbi:MAG: membrane protein insertase YidC [Micrococcales bacterium]|nr:membrane protein insertase YidC [Micrococcales bacterium]